MPPRQNPPRSNSSTFTDWTTIEMDILRGEFPPLPAIAKALRGNKPVPEIVRIFFAQLIERNRIKRPTKGRPGPDTFTREIEANLVVSTYEDELKRAKEEWIPKNVSPRDHYLPGTPVEIALHRTAEAIAGHIKGRDGGSLTPDAMKDRLKRSRRFLGRYRRSVDRDED